MSFVFGPGAHGHPLLMGHYRRGSRTIVPVQECPVHAEAGNRFAFAVHEVLVRARHPGLHGRTASRAWRGTWSPASREGARELLGTLVVTENVQAAAAGDDGGAEGDGAGRRPAPRRRTRAST